ncbi:MAG: hypothetical protein ACO1OQ_05100 [Rufibacter sp.]
MANKWEITSAHAQIYLKYVPEEDLCLVKWCGHISSEECIKTAQLFLEIQKKEHCSKIFNDKREVTGDWEDANDFLEYEWLPKAVAGGLRCFAMVMPKDLHDLNAHLELEKRMSEQCQVKLFREAETAKEWLKNCH